MKFLNVKKVMMVSLCYFVFDTATLNCTTNQPDSGKLTGGKKLKCLEVDLLNVGLEYKPMAIVKMRLAYKATLKAREAIESGVSCDKKFINDQIKSILDPVRQFFSEIQEYASKVTPLVEESLLSKAGSVEDQARERSACLILKFFESKEALDVFFDKNVNTKADLTKFCTEFATFFEDIRMSFSERVVQAEQAILEKIKNSQKQSTTRKPA